MSNFPIVATMGDSVDTVNVNGMLLKASLRIAGVNDVRYYLNYVVIERGAFGTVLVVTDGHHLGAALLDSMPAPESRHFFSRKPISSTIISKRETYQIAFPKNGKAYIHTEYCDINEVPEMEKVSFPDWSRVIPSQIDLTKSGRNVQFNEGYVQDANDFVNAFYGISRQKIATNVMLCGEKNSSCVVVPESFATKEPEALVVVMPIRAADLDKGTFFAPSFCNRGGAPVLANDSKS